ncbi:steroid 17-alpha-hydroxylase/17,20 lyase-like [Clytia hemisphaerica]|uniref:Uncharacterized protein n=1 Tax=Clytia hemisphaerica TaxID=252671 RepID=A0A7M5WQ07_9CNID
MRKLAYKSLHIYGNGMKNIERAAVEEMDGLVESLRKENEMPIPMHDRLITFSTNLTSQLLIGRTFEPNDPMLKKLLRMTKCIFTGLSYADDPIVSMPWLRFFYDTEALKLLKEGCQIRDELVREQLEYHAQTLDPDNPRDILDDILIQCQDEKFLREGDFNGVPDDHIFVMFSDIFLASIDTTALISRWAILFLLHHPEYQDKAYQELVDLGHEINSADMMSQELPYLRAIISETYRTAALTQLFMPHKTSVETSVGGQTIPKDTTVFFNMLSIHHDPRYWENPDDFNPERWIDSKTGSVISEKKMSYSPFSMGSRGCLGEKMGRMDVFLCISKLLLNFKMVPDENDPPPSYKLGTAELNRAPVTDFKVIFKSR